MSIFNNLFANFNRKGKAVKDFENDKSRLSDSELVNDDNSSETFLDIIGNLAIKQKVNSSNFLDQPRADLTTIKRFPKD